MTALLLRFPPLSEVEFSKPIFTYAILFIGQAMAQDHQEPRGSVSNDNNILLDRDILTDHVTQVRHKSKMEH